MVHTNTLCSKHFQNVKLSLHGVGPLRAILREIKFWDIEMVKDITWQF